jgi:hypothetical protein
LVASNITANVVSANTYTENANTPVIITNTLSLDLSQGSTFNVSLTSAISSINITNPPASGKVGSFMIIFNYTGTAYSVAWPASFKWPTGVAPTLTGTNGKRDFFAIMTVDGGTSYNAFISGLNL